MRSDALSECHGRRRIEVGRERDRDALMRLDVQLVEDMVGHDSAGPRASLSSQARTRSANTAGVSRGA